MIDLHSHILPGLDDGSPDLAESLEMARLAVADGTTHMACTPHVMPGVHRNATPNIAEAVQALEVEFRNAAIPLTLYVGADVHIAPDLPDRLTLGTVPTLNGSRYFLFETPQHILPAARAHWKAEREKVVCQQRRPFRRIWPAVQERVPVMGIFDFARRHASTLSALLASLAISACAGTPLTSTSSTNSVSALQPAASSTALSGGGTLQMVKDLPAPQNSQNGSEQPLSANDVLEVSVFQVDNLNRTVQVDASGQISLPLIGTMTAAGRTVRQLEKEIETAYGEKYLQSPDVAIFVKESIGQRITVDGEVNKAGIYPVSSSASLLDAIALAGGFNPIGDAGKVFVYRNIGQNKLVANYNVEEIRAGKNRNPRIHGGDVIVVFASKSKIAMNNLEDALGLASSAARIAVIP
ncbi:polysaccharide biosynthesis/export family protein [Mesorhizobium sp. M1338]|uniref:CpsB/CapC family capsule biosynthesis tyrosine phosphatase n=1 Tax=Mesorhizobium sp. M1338 TaxID=2957085 RepID=UPI00333A4C62